MESTPDGSGHRRENGRPADPEQRRPRSLGRLFALVVGVILVIVAIWLVVYVAAREQVDAGGGLSGSGMTAVASGLAATERVPPLIRTSGPTT
ncbi:hypothetical protein [Blastococcus saxobsidens]|uniref:Uncharacterized protein n=1 Tax=Blastococcus saxobsidens TaxID=138336 RepID=A0A4V2G274_9ACTN|nr:hypothetical protein [Blastococcus saxobsidens]RZU32016.1 hypothetical protein BKA19_1702 [Blastococcus saxobsidens]